MIYEYALDPELVVTWSSEDCDYFIDKFGFDRDGNATGRIISKYPYPNNNRDISWDNIVSKTLKRTCRTSKEKKIIDVLLEEIKKEKRSITRSITSRDWDPNKSWLENAEAEQEANINRPFRAILARENPRKKDYVITNTRPASLKDQSPCLWRVSRGITIARSTKVMAECFGPILRCATLILFIDPNFDPKKSKWRKPLRKFLEIIYDSKHRGVIVQYLTSKKIFSSQNVCQCEWNLFCKKCKSLKEYVGSGCDLIVCCLNKRNSDQELHDRFILTNIGGVTITYGLDIGRGKNNIHLMDRESYNTHFKLYRTHVEKEFECKKWMDDSRHSKSTS